MRKIPLRHLKYFMLIFLILFFFAGRPAELGQEMTFFHGFLIPKPVIRVGLGTNLSDVRIRASSGMKIYEIKSSYKLVADDVDEAQVKGSREKLSEKFLLQVAQSRKREEAELIAQELRMQIDHKVYVTEDTENRFKGHFVVKVGDFMTRGDALGTIQRLSEIGVQDAWILQEEIAVGESRPLWLLADDELKSLDDETVLYFIPSHQQGFLSFNGKSYRGIFVLSAGRKGVVLINILNLEDYLKGVVPGELSPYNFDEIEAHKAQAVAARTYALRNMGLYEDLGYDLCDTPSTQVYTGLDGEHPLSSRAVDETWGEVALYRGELINALYTSTCGGMTEDAENVFGGKSLPYLKATECIHEKQEEWILEAKNILPSVFMGARNISREAAVLAALKVIPRDLSSSSFQQPCSVEEAAAWIRNSQALVGAGSVEFSAGEGALNFGAFSRMLIDGFGWQERVRNLLIPGEVAHVMKNLPGVEGEARNHLAYLIVREIFIPPPESVAPERILTRSETAYYIYRAVSRNRDMLRKGIFKGVSKNRMEIAEESKREQWPFSADVIFLRNLDGETSLASRLHFLGGEKVRWLEKDGPILLLEVDYSPPTNILDRESPYHGWQVRKSREEMESRINQYYPVGRLLDIVVQKRGKSRRVTELLVKGTDSQAVVRGLRVRWVLGLRDTLFVVDREYDGNGGISHFVFSGKGWGHGVGLCQVGAFGMARAGEGYKTILKKYYRDIKMSKIY